MLDAWATLEPFHPGVNLFIADEPMNIDQLFKEESARKRSFMEKMDVNHLVEDPDSYNIDKLFADSDSSSISSATRKNKLWTKSEEEQLYEFIKGEYPHCKIANEA